MFPNVSSLSINSNVKSESPLSLSWDSDNTLSLSSITSVPCNATPTPKSPSELKKEIATLEVEISRLERYLLSLYRTAFEERVPASPTVSTDRFQLKSGSQSRVEQSFDNLKSQVEKNDVVHHVQTSLVHCWGNADYRSCSASLHSSSIGDHRKANSGRRCLADHLGASSLLNHLVTPDILSEDIVRCISTIYCRLANHAQSNVGLSASPASSVSPSSIFSSQNRSDTWSPHCNEDVVVCRQFHDLKHESGPYDAMVEVLRIRLDDDSFSYAAEMLKNFRSLVRSLEKVDPRKMNREQKLAFWINIHNALIMHAYLAYGNHNRVKTASRLKASYNVGGQCINACIIQNSIFGIRSHYPEPWLQTLFSPGRKLNTGSIRHVYALEYPEPLVHFALCSGAYSDPAVRVYTSKNIFQELKLAQEEYIQIHFAPLISRQGEVRLAKWYFVMWKCEFQVCALDLMFNFHKAYYSLDEILIAGELQESSKRSIVSLVCAHDSMVEMTTFFYSESFSCAYSLLQFKNQLMFTGSLLFCTKCLHFQLPFFCFRTHFNYVKHSTNQNDTKILLYIMLAFLLEAILLVIHSI